MLLPKGTLFYLHIPKTAGTSLREAIQSNYPDPATFRHIYAGELDPTRPNTPYLETTRKQLASIQAFYGHFSYSAHALLNLPENQFSYITILRDPVARVVSLFNHFALNPSSPFHKNIHGGMTLAELVDAKLTEETNNHMTKIIACIDARYTDDDAHLRHALDLIRRHYAFIGFAEKIQESYDRLGLLLNWQKKTVPVENKTRRKQLDVRDLDPKTLALVQQANRLDIQLYQTTRAAFDRDWRFRHPRIFNFARRFA